MSVHILRRTLIATGSAVGLAAIAFIVPASAAPVFTINPSGIPGESTATSGPQNETDLNVISDSLIQQTSPTTQTETGWAVATGFTNNGTPSNLLQTGLLNENNTGVGQAGDYGLYFTYTANVNGIGGFGAGQVGTISNFQYRLLADVGQNDVCTAGSTGATPVAAKCTDTGGNDVVLAVGSSNSGSAGFQAATGAPIFSTVNDFIVCDGTANQGLLGGATVTATGCGTYNATDYFTDPSPFYDIAFVSTTAGSVDNLTVDPVDGNATLNGIVADVNFAATPVPEPLTLAMFGAGLIGLAALGRRKQKSAC